MASRFVDLLVSILPLAIIFPLITGLFGGGFGVGQTYSVTKTATNVTRIELQKTFAATRRFYSTVWIKFKNSTAATQTYYLRIAAFLDAQTDPITEGKIIFATKVTLGVGEVAAYEISSPVTDPAQSAQQLNRWIVAELGAPADVLSFSFYESEV